MNYRGGGIFRVGSLHEQRGYTIVEVLIFVALTSFLLVIAVSNLNRQQEQTEFSQAVRDFEGVIASTINDVPSGYFPSRDNIGCQVNDAATPTVSIYDGASQGVGEDEDCVYVGKALQFVPSGSGNENKMLVYSLVGRRFTPGGSPVTTLDEADPIAAASTSFTDTVSEVEFAADLEITRVFNADTPTDRYGIVGIVTDFEGTSPASTNSNSQAVQIGGVQGTALGTDETSAINSLASLDSSTLDTSTGGIVICVTTGGDKKASITIGQSNSTGAFLQIDDYNGGCDGP